MRLHSGVPRAVPLGLLRIAVGRGVGVKREAYSDLRAALVVTRCRGELDCPYTITHRRSGASLGRVFPTIAAARRALRGLLALGDWNVSGATLLDPGSQAFRRAASAYLDSVDARKSGGPTLRPLDALDAEGL